MKKGEDYTGITIVFFCHDGQGNFVMSKRSNTCRDEHGCWDIGGGGLEHGDGIEETLQKEIQEEYCTQVRKYEFLGYREVHRNVNGIATHWLAMDFKVEIEPDCVANGEPHKFDDVAWFTLQTLPEPIHSQLPTFLELYEQRLFE